MATQVILPEMGEGVIEGMVSQWLKKEGDAVQQYEPILEIETDKVTTEATAELGGVLLKILVPAGTTVPVGTVLAYIGQPGEVVGEQAAVNGEQLSVNGEQYPVSSTQYPVASTPSPRQYTGRVSPVVARMAAEHQLDLNLIEGTGQDGRITKNDILAYLEKREAGASEQVSVNSEQVSLPTAQYPVSSTQYSVLSEQHSVSTPQPPIAPRSPILTPPAGEVVPLTTMRRAIAEHMVRSKHTSPHVTTVFEFDFSAVSAHRAAHKAQFEKDGVNLTFTAYLVAATAQALKTHPMVNSTWSDEGVVLKREINIGMATAIPDGLIVPVIKNADSLNLLGLARAVNDLANRARNKQLKTADVQDGTFSITNHGVSGSLFATPIINQPQCGILGVGMIEKRVKVIHDMIAIRPMAYVSFTFDHRILDGASADGFVGTIKQLIENWK